MLPPTATVVRRRYNICDDNVGDTVHLNRGHQLPVLCSDHGRVPDVKMPRFTAATGTASTFFPRLPVLADVVIIVMRTPGLTCAVPSTATTTATTWPGEVDGPGVTAIAAANTTPSDSRIMQHAVRRKTLPTVLTNQWQGHLATSASATTGSGVCILVHLDHSPLAAALFTADATPTNPGLVQQPMRREALAAVFADRCGKLLRSFLDRAYVSPGAAALTTPADPRLVQQPVRRQPHSAVFADLSLADAPTATFSISMQREIHTGPATASPIDGAAVCTNVNTIAATTAVVLLNPCPLCCLPPTSLVLDFGSQRLQPILWLDLYTVHSRMENSIGPLANYRQPGKQAARQTNSTCRQHM